MKLSLKHTQLLNQIKAILSFLQFGSLVFVLHQHFSFTAPHPIPMWNHATSACCLPLGLCQCCKRSLSYTLWALGCCWGVWGPCPTWASTSTLQTPLVALAADTNAEETPQGGGLWPRRDADEGEGPKWPPSKYPNIAVHVVACCLPRLQWKVVHFHVPIPALLQPTPKNVTCTGKKQEEDMCILNPHTCLESSRHRKNTSVLNKKAAYRI